MSQKEEDQAFTVRVTGPGVTLERNIPEAAALSLINSILSGSIADSGSTVVTALTPEPQAPPPPTGRPAVSLREYLEDAEATRNPDKITAIGAYIMKHQSQEEFARKEVVQGFRQAGEPSPRNITRDWSWAIRIGWIAEDPNSPKMFYVTNKGFEAIANKFSLEIRKKSALPQKRKRAQASQPAPTTAVALDED